VPQNSQKSAGLQPPRDDLKGLDTSLSGFYETAVDVKVFVFAFAFVFSLVGFLFLQLHLLLPLFRVLKIHLGLLYALAGGRCGLGA